MKKFISCLCSIFLFACLSFSPAHATDLELLIKDFSCSGERVTVHYSVVNPRNFDRYNVSIGSKVVVDGKPVGCKELKVVVPKGADGSKISEAVIDAQCAGEKPYRVISGIFSNIKRYRIDEWFSGCR